MQDEYDSPWKIALERYFPEFIAFFFPDVYNQIDWSGGYQFLDSDYSDLSDYSELSELTA